MIRRLTHTQRTSPSLHPRDHIVRPMFFTAVPTERPHAPCVLCGVREGCRHRELAHG